MKMPAVWIVGVAFLCLCICVGTAEKSASASASASVSASSCSSASASASASGTTNAVLQVDATQQGHAVSPVLWGIFFEEINHAGQNGLYSQLVSNTNFEYVDFAPWAPTDISGGVANSVVYLSLSQDNPLNYKNRQHLSVSFLSKSSSTVGITNPGFFGMTLKANSQYTLSFYAYADSDDSLPTDQQITIVLEDGYGQAQAKAVWTGLVRRSWTQFSTVLSVISTVDVVNGSLSFYFSSSLVNPSISLHFDMVSLFPVEGWRGLPFIRPDLGDMVAAMSPSFLRFPGGCFVEGDTLDHRFNWKNSVGPLEVRPGHYDLWGYYSEDGLGFFEYLLFIEKLNNAQGSRVEPVWVVNNGVSHADSIPTQDIQPWIVDALESLDFAMGDNTTKYGAMRAKLGHPQPFPINYMAIGNEDCDKPYYLENYNAFYSAFKQKYPNLTLIANCDLSSSGGQVDLWDFHVYEPTSWFYQNLNQWDSYDRSAPKVFESEYGVEVDAGQGNTNAAIAEAAYMTGIERNSDVVFMASYAPLFVNVNDRRVNPNAIVFNSYEVYGTPSYWIQAMFANAQKGTQYGSQFVLTSTSTGSGSTNLSVSSTIAAINGVSNQWYIIIKAVNYDTENSVNLSVSLQLNSGRTAGNTVQVQSLYSASVNDENSFAQPNLVVPISSTTTLSSNAFSYQLPVYSANIFRVNIFG